MAPIRLRNGDFLSSLSSMMKCQGALGRTLCLISIRRNPSHQLVWFATQMIGQSIGIEDVRPVMLTPEIRRAIHGLNVVRNPAAASGEKPRLTSGGPRHSNRREGPQIPKCPCREKCLAAERGNCTLSDVVVRAPLDL